VCRATLRAAKLGLESVTRFQVALPHLAGAKHQYVLAASKHRRPLKSTPMAAHRKSVCTSVMVNRITGVSGRSFLRTVAASAPFNRGMARSKSIKSGRDDLAFSMTSRPSVASRTTRSLYRPSSNSRTDCRMEALSSATSIALVTEQVDGFSVPDTIQENLYY
jgi:hypothetical protein